MRPPALHALSETVVAGASDPIATLVITWVIVDVVAIAIVILVVKTRRKK